MSECGSDIHSINTGRCGLGWSRQGNLMEQKNKNMKTQGDGSKREARKLPQHVLTPSLSVAPSCTRAVCSEIPGISVISLCLFLLPL